jgi:hypothetical protein
VERSEALQVMSRCITCSVLAKIDPLHPALESEWRLWSEIAERTFSSGSYDAEAEQQAHRDLNELQTRSYYKFNVLHPLIVLSATANRLPEKIERNLMQWVYDQPDGIYYVAGGRMAVFPEPGERRFARWLESLSILARFRSGREVISDALHYVRSLVSPDDLWEYKISPGSNPSFPLSESHRNPMSKRIDCSIPVLTLLRLCQTNFR